MLTAMCVFAGCNRQPAQTEKDMKQLSFTEQQAAWMTAIAANEAKGDQIRLESAIHNGLEADLTVSQIKEAQKKKLKRKNRRKTLLWGISEWNF